MNPSPAIPRPLPATDSGPLEGWEAEIDRQMGELEPRLIDVRRHLHAHPEPSREERETSAYIASQLAAAGVEPHLCRDGLGVIAETVLGTPAADAPLIALRADLDALRIQDAKSTAYASQRPGLCHACGHDAHATMVLGAALFAAANSGRTIDAVGARLRFVFQPAEETSEGARWLVEQGAVDDVDAILGVHVDPERPLGSVGIRYGTLTANCDEVEIIVEGKGGHSARPHHTLDPIAAAAHVVSALYQFLPRAVDSRSPSVFSVGKIAGGTLPNVIPDRVQILGTLRTLESETRTTLKNRIEEIVHGVKELSRTSMRVRFTTPIDSVENDHRVTAALERASRRVLGDAGVQMIARPSMGGEDFSAYLTRVPGSLLRIGCAPPGFAAPFLHAPEFDIDERALALGSRILLRAALILSAGVREAVIASSVAAPPP
ncbi:MAG: amidohydrolase [Planctomycetaceae bacterium]|nr:amidohydrolase [Planctomycetaceae bacterium]